MMNPDKDRIAREAARLIETGKSGSIDQAIRDAAEALGLNGEGRPGRVLVRRHAQAMAMQALGREGYEQAVREVWRLAEELMTALEQAFADSHTRLVGRAAAGRIDAGVTLHVRMYTNADVTALAKSLVEYGYGEPAFETSDTRLGRVERLRFVEDGREIVVTRMPPHARESAPMDLFTARPIEAIELQQLRRKLSPA